MARTTSSLRLIIATAIVALLPAIALLTLVCRYAVNVPYMDEWSEISILKGPAHFPKFATLLSQHNEHRIAAVRLIIWAATSISNGDMRAAIAVTLALAMLASLLAMLLLRRTLPREQPWQPWWLAINLLILSLVQYENWLWAFQVQFILPIACLLAGLVLIQVLPAGWIQTLLCMLLSLVGAYSITNGLLVSVLLPIAMLANHPRLSLERCIAWSYFIPALWIYYFHDWQTVPYHPDLHWCIHNPQRAAQYLLVFLGSCLARNTSTSVATWIGGAILAVWFAQLAYLATHRHRGDLLQRAAPWLALGVFAVVSATMAACGRAALGIQQAQSSRYTTTSLQLLVAIIALWPILAPTIPSAWFAYTEKAFGTVAAIALLVAVLIAQMRSAKSMRLEGANRLRGQAGLELINYPNSDAVLSALYSVPGDIHWAVLEVNDLHRLHPPVLPANAFASIASQTAAVGFFRPPTTQGDGSLLISGSSHLPSGRCPDCIVFAHDDADHSTVIWMIPVPITKTEVSTMPASERVPGSWQAIIPAQQLPPGNSPISAWAFDATTRTAYRIAPSAP